MSTVFLEVFSAASSYDRRRGEVRVWLLGIAARCLADQSPFLLVAHAAIRALRPGGALAPQPATAASVLRASAAALDRLGGSRALGPDDYLYTRTAE